jgi:hypothetical protein
LSCFCRTRRDVLVLAHRRGHVAHLGGKLAGAHARVEIFGIERAEANRDLGGALLVAARLALLGDLHEELLGIGQRALLRGKITRLEQCVFVVRLELEDLLEEGQRLRIEALLRQVIGDSRVLLETFSIFLERTYKSPREFALFQSRGWAPTTLTYSAIAASTLPSFKAFSAAFSAASRSNGGTMRALNQWYQTGSLV